MDRRHFLGTTAAAATLAAAPILSPRRVQAETGTDAVAAPGGTRSPFQRRLGLATYSLWQFRHEQWRPVERCLEAAAEMGFDGVEILQRQLEDTGPEALMKIKRRAFELGLSLIGYSTHQGFLTPDPEQRAASIGHTIECLQQAAALGIPTIRVNTGTWGTSGSFNELMANKGIEEPIEGHTDEEGFGWVIDSFEKLAPEAAKLGVVMGLENHWGLGRTAEGVRRIIDEVDSPWLRATLDTGNFLEDKYRQMELMAPATVLVQAKTYFGEGWWYTLDIDYARVRTILDAANYRGWISLEFEGRDDPAEGVPASLELLRRHFG